MTQYGQKGLVRRILMMVTAVVFSAGLASLTQGGTRAAILAGWIVAACLVGGVVIGLVLRKGPIGRGERSPQLVLAGKLMFPLLVALVALLLWRPGVVEPLRTGPFLVCTFITAGLMMVVGRMGEEPAVQPRR